MVNRRCPRYLVPISGHSGTRYRIETATFMLGDVKLFLHKRSEHEPGWPRRDEITSRWRWTTWIARARS